MGWSEVTDRRDKSSPTFRSPQSTLGSGSSIYLSVNLDSGLVSVYTEDCLTCRNILYSQTVCQFEELEKLFQTSLTHLISSEQQDLFVPNSKSLNKPILNKESPKIDPLKDGSIDLEAFGNIFRRWDEEEK